MMSRSLFQRLFAVFSLALGAARLGLMPMAAHAAPLDANAFASLGSSPFGAPGVYTIDASVTQSAPTLTGPGISGAINGVFFDPTPGNITNQDEIAVFTFDAIAIGAGVTVQGARTSQSRPVALLSKSSFALAGVISFNAADGTGHDVATNLGGDGGAAGPGGGGGGGGGAGTGNDFEDDHYPIGTPGVGGLGQVEGTIGKPVHFDAQGRVTGEGGDGGDIVTGGGGVRGGDNRSDGGSSGGGGSFGGDGGDGFAPGSIVGRGGFGYGDLRTTLQGGSGGGGGGGNQSDSADGGGGGGGAVEMGAVTSMALTGSVNANGGAAGAEYGGGGGGGGILIHGQAVTFSGAASLNASGGFANLGGGGGGGRVHIAATSAITSQNTELRARVNVQGKGKNSRIGGPGVLTTAGTLIITDPTVTTTVDENDASDPASGTGISFREAIIIANGTSGAKTIAFNLPAAQSVAGVWTINLTGALPNLTQSVTINGPGAKQLVVRRDTGGDYRIFNIPTGGLSVVISGLTIRDGRVSSAPLFGGGIYSASALTLADCLITNNQVANAGGAGGGVAMDNSDGTFTGCTLSNNTATNQGGGINYSGNGGRTLTLRNCTISGNTAQGGLGGGVLNVSFSGSSTVQATNCTIAQNTGSGGGGILTQGIGSGVSATTFLSNCIVANNTAPNLRTLGTSGGTGVITSQGYNLASDNGGGFLNQPTDQINTAPQIGPLQDNSGQTPTHALLPGGPAINTGNTTLATDQRGIARPQGVADDKGAFEYVFAESLFVTTTADEDNTTSDPGFGSGTSLREALRFANSDGVASAITFSPTVFAAPRRTITLAGTPLPTIVADNTLSITAPAAGVEISGNNQSRVFQVNNSATATLTALTIRNGNAGANQGAGVFNLGTLLVDRCTVSGNTAGNGGGIYSDTTLSGFQETLTIRNSTISGNTASNNGGGVYNVDGLTVIESSTITANTAPAAKGSGVASFGDTGTRTEVHNTIIAANANTDVDFVQGGANSFQSNGYNLIGDGNATGDFAATADQLLGNSSPFLGPLQNNGGPAFTHAVLLSSPAQNTGASALGTDQRGLARVFGAAADKGAYELQYESYAFWAGYRLPPGVPAAALAPDADFDGDGISNAIEQVLGLDPATPSALSDALAFEIQGNYLVLQFKRSILTDPAKLFAEQSLNLQIWSSAGILYQNLGATGNGTSELIQAFLPINGAPRIFGRLHYTP